MQLLSHCGRTHKKMQKSKVLLSDKKTNLKNSINNKCGDLQFGENIKLAEKKEIR